MYIKEVILDGFKSYAHRTVVPQFDPSFNAITGHNGSGKSNILDGICFVLGISMLSQVRVASLPQLIYKHGQAGVTKASVTVVFDNRDKGEGRCPVGYEHIDEITVTRQIIMGGRNKYLVNGKLAQQSQVQGLFHSVQLNVNNPHFLIMQGRITKVMGMKPAELLGLMEEAAGTKMFEMKKASTKRTMERKDKKLDEINTIINTELNPKLHRLKIQVEEYERYCHLQIEIDRTGRFVVAAGYERNKEAYRTNELKLERASTRVEEAKENIRDLDIQQKRLQKEVDKLKMKLAEEKENSTGHLQRNEREHANRVTEANMRVVNREKDVDSEKRKLADIDANAKEVRTAINAKKKEGAHAQKAFNDISTKMESMRTQLHNTQNQLELLNSGVAAGEDGQSLIEQLTEWKRKAAEFHAEAQQTDVRVRHLSKDLQQKKKLASKQDAEAQSFQQESTRISTELAQAETTLRGVGYNPEAAAQLANQVEEARRIARQLSQEVGMLNARLRNLRVDYADPYRGFDRSAVKGLVATLVTIQDRKYTTAVEVAAGGRLYNLVVDRVETGKALLKDDRTMKTRITLIPLDGIRADVLDRRVVDRAAQVTDGQARLALQLIGYDDEVAAAMKYAFGTTFVCDTPEAGHKVAYTKDLGYRAITVAGDEYNPHGTMTGGARGNLGDTLAAVNTLNDKMAELERANQRCAELERAHAASQASRQQYEVAHRAYEVKQTEAEQLRLRMERSNHHQIIQECGRIEAEIKELQEALTRLKPATKDAEARCHAIEDEMKSFKGGQDKINNAKKEVERLKKAIEESSPKLEEKNHLMQTNVVEMEQLERSAKDISRQMDEQQAAIEEAVSHVNEVKSVHKEAKAAWEAAKAELQQALDVLQKADSSIARKQEELEQLAKQEEETNLEIKNLEHTAKTAKRDLANAEEYTRRLLRDNPWIEQYKHLFGKPGDEFDFTKRNAREASQTLEGLREEQRIKSKEVNKKAVAMYETVEQEYQQLMAKRAQVEKDKATIEKVMEELDQKKKVQLQETHQKVSKDFDSIFRTLLPGTMAQLVAEKAPDGNLTGLEVRVGFSGVWKESLSELSGGQRSLLALALILSLLLFNPAPMYILDEVDAALDPSHTQNIGKMLRAHFKNSQFIVVSLKAGMFNNANVLFKVREVAGQSAIARTVNT